MSGAAQFTRVPSKWRPRLSLIIALMLTAVLALPLLGVFFFRIYENQLIRQTEAELIAQSAVLSVMFKRAAEAVPAAELPLGAKAPDNPQPTENGIWQPILPSLDLARDDIRPRRPAGQAPTVMPTPRFLAIGELLLPDLVETQKITLAGFRVLDPKGVVIAGREEMGLSLAEIPEVADALQGHFRSVLRQRISQHAPPPLYSISRGTSVRIFTALPVIVRNQVAGVIYASRTPPNIMKHLHEEREKVALAALSMVFLTLLIGLAFHVTISGPIRDLLARTRAIASGDRAAIRPLNRHGTAELAALTQGFLDMAGGMAARSDFVATFAAHVSHELKSPLTSIQGAAELLRDDLDVAGNAMDDTARHRFLDNILADTRRLTAIVNRLRELARAEAIPTAGSTTLAAVVADLRSEFPQLAITVTGDPVRGVGMAAESLHIVLAHLADNAARHGATRLELLAHGAPDHPRLVVRDNGTGISPNNRARIFDDFFTTRRDTGGTGMGLAIVRAMLAAHGGGIALIDGTHGTAFDLALPEPRPS